MNDLLVKELSSSAECRQGVLEGVNQLADKVSCTMGAQGRNILYETKFGKAKSTKDGVTVAKEIFLEKPLHSLGAELIKEAAEKTVNECGDSTTNTVVLSREIMKLANDAINKGCHPIQLKRGIESATKDIIDLLAKKRVRLKKKDYFNVANISANNDKVLGKIISDAFKKAGKNGVVLHDKSHDETTHIKTWEGMLIDRGVANRDMVTNPSLGTMEIENPYVFVCDKPIDDHNEIMFLFEFLHKQKQQGKDESVVIIGELDKKVEAIISYNRRKNNTKVFYLKAPSFASKRTDLMEDIALATGSTLMRKDSTDNYAALGVGILGQCKKIFSNETETILDIDKEKYQEKIDNKIKELESLKSKASSTRHKMQKKFLEERIGKLSCSVATIMVGANSEIELDEKIDRVDDSVNALRSAIEEGIVLGGGLALYNASYDLYRDSCKYHNDFIKGYCVLQEAIRKPLRQILQNAGVESADETEEKIFDSDNENTGYNVSTFEYCDFYKEGIIDPHKAIRCALQNASSVASTFLLTDGTITIKREQ